MLQSRLTVLGEMPSTSAASSTLNPPKNRSSTTRPCRASIFDKRVSDSSTASSSADCCSEKMKASSSETFLCAPPRFCRRWPRASVDQDTPASIRAATPRKCATLPNSPLACSTSFREDFMQPKRSPVEYGLDARGACNSPHSRRSSAYTTGSQLRSLRRRHRV